MSELRAFVGHSFTKEDEPVVHEFLKFFKTLNGIIPFTWDHALPAESEDLKTKVLQKIDGKNIFIGICTRKEQVSTGVPLKTIFGFQVGKSKIEWKTSDWIIQEIGLSIGRGLHLVLLVEDGVRQPGGLQGNLNYIPFSRDKPQECFIPILEMLKSLRLRDSTPMVSASDTARDQGDTSKSETGKRKDWLTPKPDWLQNDYDFAMLFAILEKNEPKQAEIDRAFKASKLATHNKAIIGWDAASEFKKIAHGSGGKLDRLKSLAILHPDNYLVLMNLGRAYDHFENWAEAGKAYKMAADSSEQPTDAIAGLRFAALSSHESHKHADVIKLTEEIRRRATTSGDEVAALHALKSICDKSMKTTLATSLQERLLELEPGSVEDRFALAYSHSQADNNDISIYHYTRIPHSDRTGLAHNNLGVAYARFKLRSLAVTSLKAAKTKQETLGMSNLALRYLNAGFLAEAKAECDEAVRIPYYNNNVNLILSQIADKPDDESKTEEEILARGRAKSEFLRKLGRSACAITPTNVRTAWVHHKYGPLKMSLNGEKLEAVGSFRRTSNSLPNAFFGNPPTATASEKLVEVKISGSLFGRASEGSLTFDDASPPGAGLLIIPQTIQILMYLGDDGACWYVMEQPNSATPTYYTLTPS